MNITKLCDEMRMYGRNIRLTGNIVFFVIGFLFIPLTLCSQLESYVLAKDSLFNFKTDTTFTTEEQFELTMNLIGLYENKNKKKTEGYIITAIDLAGKLEKVSEKKMLIQKLGTNYNAGFNYEKADQQFQKLAVITEEAGIEIDMASVYLLIASNYFDWSKYSLAREYYSMAKVLYEGLGYKKGNATALIGLSSIASTYADYELALGQMQQARQIYVEINDTLSLASTTLGLGVIMEDWSKLSSALSYYKQSLKHFTETKNSIQQINLLLHIGDVYLKQNKYNDALDSYREAMAYNKHEKHRKLESICYSNLGEIYYQLENYDSALYYQHKALVIKYTVGDRKRIAISLLNLAEIYIALGEIDKSEKYLSECYKLSKEMKLKELEMRSLLLMSELYGKMLDYKKSKDLLLDYIALKDEIFSSRNRKLLNEAEVRYESERIEKENEILKQKDAINTLRFVRENDTKIMGFLILVFISIISIITILFINFRNRTNKRNYSLLAKKNKEITLQKEELSKLNRDIYFSREQYRSIVENATIGMYRIHPNGTILFANNGLINMMGYANFDEMKSANMNIFHENRKLFIKELEDISVVSAREDIWVRKDGASMYVYESAWVVCDDENNILHYEGVVEDVTKRKEAEKALGKSKLALESLNGSLQEKNRELEIAKNKAVSANNIKSQFIANVSHEIRTPLNSIMGFAEILSTKLESTKQKSNVDAIITSSNSLLSLINDILDMSKIQAGEVKVNNQNVNLFHLVEDVHKVFSLIFVSKKLKFVVDISENVPPTVFIDRLKIRQVLFNLISNAIKFTEKGVISLCISGAKYDESYFNLEIYVKDTGIGIALEEQDTIFEAFKQSSTNVGSSAGTGLGLSITKRLIEIMGGELSLESAPNKGSVFTIFLPKVKYIDRDGNPIIETNILSDNSDYTCNFQVRDEFLDMEMKISDEEADIVGNKLSVEWKLANNGKMINDIQMFADLLANVAHEYSIIDLLKLSEKLQNAIQIFDIEYVDKLLELLGENIFEK